MKKTIACILLSAVMCPALLSGCGGKNTPQKEDVTLIIKSPELSMAPVNKPDIEMSNTFLEQAGAAFAGQYEDANVTIQVETFAYVDEVTAITESFDTEDATDILYEGYFNMASYLHTGKVVPLDDIISKELRGDIDDASWAMSTADGKTYMMPFLSMQNILIYNKELFQSCGLAQYTADGTVIQNWTLDEWGEILDTLAANLPQNAYPIMMFAKNNQGDTHIMSFIRAFGSTIFDENNNFDFESEEAVKALTWMQDGAGRGWYPPHAENIELADTSELFSHGQLAIQLFNNTNCDLTLFKGNISCYILLLKSPLTLENTKFIAGELSLKVSLMLYLPIGHYEP